MLIRISLFLGLRTRGFLFLWISLEINLLGFLLWIKGRQDPSAELIKYFVVQRLGSVLVLMGLVANELIGWRERAIVLGLILKLGLAPLHLWFIHILKSLKLIRLFLLFTAQKLLPLLALVSLLTLKRRRVLILTRLLFGRLGALFQSSWKEVLGYSSVFTGAWFILSFTQVEVILLFFLVYATSLSLVLSSGLGQEASNRFRRRLREFIGDLRLLFLGLIRLAGVPPFLGFYAKLTVILGATDLAPVWLLFGVIVRSIFIVYIYLRLFYSMCSGEAQHLVVRITSSRFSLFTVPLLGFIFFLMFRVSVSTLRFDLKNNN